MGMGIIAAEHERAAALAQRVEKDEDAAANEDEVREVSERVNLAAEEKQQLQTQVPIVRMSMCFVLPLPQQNSTDNTLTTLG